MHFIDFYILVEERHVNYVVVFHEKRLFSWLFLSLFLRIKVPIIIPYLVLIISIYLVIGPIIDNPQIEYLYALGFILAGLIFYVPFVKFGMTPRFMSKYPHCPRKSLKILIRFIFLHLMRRQSDIVPAIAVGGCTDYNDGNVWLRMRDGINTLHRREKH